MANVASSSTGERVLQRSDNVLWSIAPPGVMLHHLGIPAYVELDALGYSLWAYLDGGRTADEAICRAVASAGGDSTKAQAEEILGFLNSHGFVVERA